MILNVHFDHEWRSAEAADQVSGLISELIGALRYERQGEFVSPGSNALLCFAKERFNHKLRQTKRTEGHLVVGLNKLTGYGALMWYRSSSDPVWVSDNPQPPDFDPRVVSDPGYPLFHESSSSLPIGQFKEALEEFCYAGSGGRPTSIRWVRSDICGRRMDGGYFDRVEIASDRFGGEGISRGMIGYVIEGWPGSDLWVEIMDADGLTATRITAGTGDLRLLTRGSAGFWPFLYCRALSRDRQNRLMVASHSGRCGRH